MIWLKTAGMPPKGFLELAFHPHGIGSYRQPGGNPGRGAAQTGAFSYQTLRALRL